MKKKLHSIVSVVILSGLLMACNSGKDAVKKAENEVFAIHDEIMPKVMGDLVTLKKQLNQRVVLLDSLKAGESAAATLRTGEEKEQATRLIHDLTLADSLMSNWMDQYSNDTIEKIPSEEALNYLAAQKDQITDVKTKVNSSIEQARQFLGKK